MRTLAPTAGLSALRALVDRLGREPVGAVPAAPPTPPNTATAAQPARRAAVDSGAKAPAAPGQAAAPPLMPPPAPRPLKSVQRHEANWRRLRAEQRLRRLREAVPPQAGPLHSATLVHRALAQMHAVSPAYLEAWLRGVDNLLAVERIAARQRR